MCVSENTTQVEAGREKGQGKGKPDRWQRGQIPGYYHTREKITNRGLPSSSLTMTPGQADEEMRSDR